jgi:hypothetical protein
MTWQTLRVGADANEAGIGAVLGVSGSERFQTGYANREQHGHTTTMD